jgi:hypothetical protein
MDRGRRRGVRELSTESAASSGSASGWYSDPGHRHQARYWDGSVWSVWTFDKGEVTSDPLPALGRKFDPWAEVGRLILIVVFTPVMLVGLYFLGAEGPGATETFFSMGLLFLILPSSGAVFAAVVMLGSKWTRILVPVVLSLSFLFLAGDRALLTDSTAVPPDYDYVSCGSVLHPGSDVKDCRDWRDDQEVLALLELGGSVALVALSVGQLVLIRKWQRGELPRPPSTTTTSWL